MVCEVDAAKGGAAAAKTAWLLRVIAFSNHEAGMRAQPWAARPTIVECGPLPLLETTTGDVQFVHLSFQECGGLRI